MSSDRQLNYVNNLQNRDQNLYYVDDASELNSINLEENDKIYAINDNKLFQMEIVDQEEELSGSIVSFNGRNNTKIKSLVANIEPVQDLHGYDHPWPGGGWENILPPLTSATKNGVTITVSDDGTVTINGTATEDTYFDSYFSASWTTGTTIHLMAFNPVASSSNRLSLFIITSSGYPQVNLNTENAAFSSLAAAADITATRCRLRVPSGVTYTDFIFRPMLKIGGTAPTAYSSYSNECPISGWTGAEIEQRGKNLLENIGVGLKNRGITAVFNDDGTVTLFGTNDGSGYSRFVINGHFQAENGVEYTMSGAISSNITIRNVGARVSDTGNGINFTGTGGSQSIEIRVLANTAISGNVVVKPMICLASSTATDYEPYQGSSLSINWQDEVGIVHGGTLAISDDGSCKLTMDRAIVNAKDLNWQKNNNQPNPNGAFFIASENVPFSGWNVFGQQSAISNVFVKASPTGNQNIEAENTFWWNNLSTGYRCIWGDASASTANDLIQFLTENNVVFCAKLAIPITYTLTDVTMLSSVLGTNNIWSDTGDINIKITEKGITAFELKPHT